MHRVGAKCVRCSGAVCKKMCLSKFKKTELETFTDFYLRVKCYSFE